MMASILVNFPSSMFLRNAAGERTSSKSRPRRLRHFSSLPSRSTSSRSSQPRAFSSAARLRPIKPPAPVTTIRLATLVLPLAVHPRNFLNHVGCRAAFDHLRQHHLAAVRLHHFTAADIMRPVFSFHQDLRQNLGDDSLRLRVAEVNHVVHGPQRCQNIRAVLFVIDGPVVALVHLDGCVSVDRYHQRIALVAGKGQVGHMAPVQYVEAPVGENQLLALRHQPVPLGAHLLNRQYLWVCDLHCTHLSGTVGVEGTCQARRRTLSKAGIWLKSGTSSEAPARISRVRLAMFQPNRRSSSLATPTQSPTSFCVSRISTGPSPKSEE